MVTNIWCWKNDLDSCNLSFLLYTVEIIASNFKKNTVEITETFLDKILECIISLLQSG